MAFQMVQPVLTKFAVSIGASLTVGGTIAGIFSITALVVRPFSGAIADKFNKKWLMVGATSVIAVSVLCYSLAANVGMLFGFRVVHGIAFAVSSTTNMAFATSFIPEKRMGEGIGYLGLGQILATAVGPNISVWASTNLGYNWTFVISFGMSATAALLMMLIKYRQPIKKSAEKFKLRISDMIALKIIPLAILGGIFSLANGLISAFLVMLGDERGIANVGIFFTLNAIFLLMVRPFSGKLNDKKGLNFILIPSYIIAAAAMALLAGATATWMVAAAGALKAIGQGAGQPALQAECIKMLPEKRGVATSTYYIGADVGQGLGPIVGGAISTAFGYGATYTGAAVLLVVGMVCFVIYRKFSEKKKLSKA